MRSDEPLSSSPITQLQIVTFTGQGSHLHGYLRYLIKIKVLAEVLVRNQMHQYS